MICLETCLHFAIVLSRSKASASSSNFWNVEKTLSWHFSNAHVHASASVCRFTPPNVVDSPQNVHCTEGTTLLQTKKAQVNLIIEGKRVLQHQFSIPAHGRHGHYKLVWVPVVYKGPLCPTSVTTYIMLFPFPYKYNCFTACMHATWVT